MHPRRGFDFERCIPRLRVRLTVRRQGDSPVTEEGSDVTGLTDRWEQR